MALRPQHRRADARPARAGWPLASLARSARTSVWGQLAIQIGMIAFAVLVYFGVRGLTEGSVALAHANGERLVALERDLGIWWEPWLQGLIAEDATLVTLANWIYIWGHWPLIGAAAAWLFVADRSAFALLRNAIFVSGAIGLVVFATFPVAPPRLMDLGLIDTVTQNSEAYRTLQPPELVNQYAAMPSLHFGFNLLVGVVIARHARHRVAWAFAILVPIAMAAAVVLTGNHFVIDVVAGGVVALAGLWLVMRLGPVLRNRLRRVASGPWQSRAARPRAPRC